MTLDEVADELYGLPLADFTATRNTRAKRARDDGDRDLAEQIKDLAKPTVAGWLVNRLVRTHPGELAPLRDLGTRLREATTKLRGDDLRALTRQRHQLVGVLVAQARRLGADEGQQVSDQVARALEQTFDAALADPDAAEQVLAGRLADALQPEGFVLGGAAPARAAKSKPRDDTAAKRALADAQRRRDGVREKAATADRLVADLEAQLAAARRDAKHAHADLGRAEKAVADARAKLR